MIETAAEKLLPRTLLTQPAKRRAVSLLGYF